MYLIFYYIFMQCRMILHMGYIQSLISYINSLLTELTVCDKIPKSHFQSCEYSCDSVKVLVRLQGHTTKFLIYSSRNYSPVFWKLVILIFNTEVCFIFHTSLKKIEGILSLHSNIQYQILFSHFFFYLYRIIEQNIFLLGKKNHF